MSRWGTRPGPCQGCRVGRTCRLSRWPRMNVSTSPVPRLAGARRAYRELLGPDVESLSPVKRALNLVIVFVGHLVDSRLLCDRDHVDDVHCSKGSAPDRDLRTACGTYCGWTRSTHSAHGRADVPGQSSFHRQYPEAARLASTSSRRGRRRGAHRWRESPESEQPSHRYS